MTLSKLSVPVGIVASMLVTAASAGGSYMALKGKDDIAAEKIEKLEAAKAKVEEDVSEVKASLSGIHAAMDAQQRTLDRIERRLDRWGGDRERPASLSHRP